MVTLMGGWDYKPGVDAQLWAATDLNRRITLDDEDARWAFDRAPIDEQAAGLARIANDPDDGKRRISKMVAAWRMGGLLALEVFETEMHVMAERAPTVSKALMDDRNALWMPKIQGLVARLEPALSVFGSGSLAGPAGLLARLERSGLPVVPV